MNGDDMARGARNGPEGVDPEVERLAEEPMDAADVQVLQEVAALFDQVDPVPDDLVDRVRFSLALDEMFSEVARITRMSVDALAVRNEPTAEVRTETLTFSADELTVMVSITRGRYLLTTSTSIFLARMGPFISLMRIANNHKMNRQTSFIPVNSHTPSW